MLKEKYSLVKFPHIFISDRKKSVESSSKPDRTEKKGRFSALFSKSKSDVKPVDNFKVSLNVTFCMKNGMLFFILILKGWI